MAVKDLAYVVSAQATLTPFQAHRVTEPELEWVLLLPFRTDLVLPILGTLEVI